MYAVPTQEAYLFVSNVIFGQGTVGTRYIASDTPVHFLDFVIRAWIKGITQAIAHKVDAQDG